MSTDAWPLYDGPLHLWFRKGGWWFRVYAGPGPRCLPRTAPDAATSRDRDTDRKAER